MVILWISRKPPLDGIIVVTSPQELVHLIVRKAYNMAKSMDIPVLGIIENMSYLKCPDCGKQIKMFGDSHSEAIAAELGTEVLGKMPIDPTIAELCDKGEIEQINNEYLTRAIDCVTELAERNKV